MKNFIVLTNFIFTHIEFYSVFFCLFEIPSNAVIFQESGTGCYIIESWFNFFFFFLFFDFYYFLFVFFFFVCYFFNITPAII
ncbi:hypothetical protein ERX70_10025 [Salmonella enterica]|nr:hypothetical protein [Salmonella enterica]